MPQETVSIIVPVYNTAPYLERCVSSLRRQTYEAVELILVDDGSTDQSGAMCDRYGEEDRRIKVLHKENGGLISAWQAGVTASQGAYLCFVDSDDWVDPEMIEEMVKHLAFTGKEMVCCNYLIERPKAATRESHGLEPGCYEGKALEEVFHELLGHEHRRVCLSRCMKLISRELIENNLKFCNEKLKMGEDVNIILPALLDARRLVIMREAYYYHYFYNNASMVHAYDRKLYENIRLLREIILAVFREKAKTNGLDLTEAEIGRQCNREYIFLLMLVLKNEARGNRRGQDYLKNIREICRRDRTKELVRRYPVPVTEKANRLLYLILRCPCGVTVRLLRLAMKMFYGF